MKPEEFCRWLQGFAELNGETPTPAQWKLIKEHLQLVYKKQTSTLEQTLKGARLSPFGRDDSIC